MALLTDQFRIFTAERFRKALEGPDPTQSDLLAVVLEIAFMCS